ncbi:uncharacterized protein EMH_0035130 [Eimeria mitis]|uniref:Uncharacterized protein n=1 Tax=Eimeria mitis TaxID=44415 RepID=U6K6Q4_9EIME|nr:uncharacterized protein EMH_0035130 [Eimeria mitis]CDJ31163.1 hypothetical protein, conserved [Eimeria mitis]
MAIPLRLTPFGLEQRSAYVQQDRHDEYYEELLSPRHSRSARQDCCCISVLLLGDQNAGKSALLYSLVASKDPRYTALTSLLPIIQGEFSNRREILPRTGASAVLATDKRGLGSTATVQVDPDCAPTVTTEKDEREQLHRMLPENTVTDEVNTHTGTVTAMATEAVEALVSRSRDELPFLDSDVARSAALLSAEDFAFFCNEFSLQVQQQQQQHQLHGLWRKVNDNRYVLLHLLEFGGDHLDRMHSFYNLDGSRNSMASSSSSTSNSTCCGKCAFSSNCSKCDQAAAAALLRRERDSESQDAAFKALYNSAREATADEAAGSNESADQTPVTPAAQDGGASVSATHATVLAQSLRRSFELAAEVPLLVYFVNCSTMFIPPVSRNVAASAAVTAIELSSPAFLRLLLRLHSCCSFVQPAGNRMRPIHFACSRLSCRSATSAATDEVTSDASDRATADSATGCCCSGFDERESFRKALEALKRFVWMASSAAGSESGASRTVAGAAAAAAAEKNIASVSMCLDQPFESLYSRFLSDTDNSSDSSCSTGTGGDRIPTNISWAPFEDCWGVSACARLKAEDERLQQCASVVFLERLLRFVWRVCSPFPFCSSLTFRGVSAVRVLERNSHWQQKQHLSPPQDHQLQHEAWGPGWQLCVVSIISFLARVFFLLAEAEELAEACTEAAVGSGTEANVREHQQLDKRALPATDTENEINTVLEIGGFKNQEDESASWKQLQLLQQNNIITGETGRQLISLFSACANLHRQQQHQVSPNEVSVDLWLSYTDWRDFIADFDPVEQQNASQDQQKQQTHITLSATGEIVIASAVEGDYLLLLPAAAAAAAFNPLARELVSLGCCLPCCFNGGPWAPVAVQLYIDLPGIGNQLHLLLLPEVLKEHFSDIQQTLQEAHYPPVPLSRKELLREGLVPCLAAVRLPFHPAVCELVNSVLSSCAREPLPADFWTAGAAATVAAVTTSASAPEEADAEYGRLSKLATVRNTAGAAVDAAGRNAQALLQQRLQQELLHSENTGEKVFGEKTLINCLQVLLHLSGDVVLLQQMAAVAISVKGSEQQKGCLESQGESETKQEWKRRIGGPYCSQNQLFWTVDLQLPAEEPPEASVTGSGNGAPAVNECCGAQTANSDVFTCTLRSINRELTEFGLLLLPVPQTSPILPPV